ncbi:MAG: RIP metalloprotease RseP [Patescibacteria group bacterium]|jgi:regulator of sigma E protease
MLFTIVTFFAVLGILVLVHELGHFFAARKGGVKVEEFGLGLPPRIFGFYKNDEGKWKPVGLKTKQVNGTIWSLNWIPLGGFVKIKGEEGGNAEEEDSFAHKSVLRRIWIISAGVLMNVVLAIVFLSFGLAFGSPQMIDDSKLPAFAKIRDVQIRIMEVLPDSPAARAGLEVADTLLTVDGQTFSRVEDFQDYFNQKIGITVQLEIERKQKKLAKELVPEVIPQIGRGGMGVALVQTGFVSYPWYIAPFYGVIETVKMIGGIIMGFYLIIKSLIISQQMIGDVYGPVGIATLVGDAARLGFLYILQFTAMLSVIIAVINFLPFPALDGGRVFFLLIEGLRGKPVNQKLETAMHNIGFALLMILAVVITFRDIARISSGFLGWWQKISGLF